MAVRDRKHYNSRKPNICLEQEGIEKLMRIYLIKFLRGYYFIYSLRQVLVLGILLLLGYYFGNMRMMIMRTEVSHSCFLFNSGIFFHSSFLEFDVFFPFSLKAAQVENENLNFCFFWWRFQLRVRARKERKGSLKNEVKQL